MTVVAPVDDHDDHGHDDHADDHDELEALVEDEGIDVDTFKIILLCVMILCVGLGLVPKVWGACRNSDTTLSFLNCFSAGIFLAMALIHMMPESAEVYLLWAAEENIERPFPLPYVMFFVGYMLILAIDRVAARKYHLEEHEHSTNSNTMSVHQMDTANKNDGKVLPNEYEMGAVVVSP